MTLAVLLDGRSDEFDLRTLLHSRLCDILNHLQQVTDSLDAEKMKPSNIIYSLRVDTEQVESGYHRTG